MPADPHLPDAPPATGQATQSMLPRRARSWRMFVSVVVLGLLVCGSLWGDDDDFPFGPMRMYSTSTDPNSRVGNTGMYGTIASGEETRLVWADLGVRRAEIEGQLPRFREHPELLAAVAEMYHQKFPDRPRLVKIRIQRNYQDLVDGRVAGRHSAVLAEWDLR